MKPKIKIKIKQLMLPIFLLSICTAFFLVASSLNYFTQKKDFVKWGSPDETANYAFTKLFAEKGELMIYENYNVITGEIIHPRSMRSDFGRIKPVSFLGIILIYGTIAKYVGTSIIPFLTPLVAAIGLIYYYLLVRRLFGKDNALISVLILACFPVYFYYSARSMFHNVLFVVLFLIGLYYAVIMAIKPPQPLWKRAWLGLKILWHKLSGKRIEVPENEEVEAEQLTDFQYAMKYKYLPLVHAALAGAFLGLAIMTRTSELIWMGPLFAILWIFNLRRVGVLKLVTILLFGFIALQPLFYWNNFLFGSPFSGGYQEMNRTLDGLTSAGGQLAKNMAGGQFSGFKAYAGKLMQNIFYFGFHPHQSLAMFYHYVVQMFPWLFYGSALGAILLIVSFAIKPKKKYLVYLIGLVLISAILVYYYGSWKFNDNPDPKSFTIGNSYTRYWLPIYLGMIPLLALFINRLAGILTFMVPGLKGEKPKWHDYRHSVITMSVSLLAVAAIFFWSLNFVWAGSDEGLVYALGKSQDAYAQRQAVLGLTEKNAAIITFYHDKLFFPERKVVFGLFDDKNMIARYALLAKFMPLYYYNFTFPTKDFNYLNSRRLANFGLKLTVVKKINHDFTLYKLNLIK